MGCQLSAIFRSRRSLKGEVIAQDIWRNIASMISRREFVQTSVAAGLVAAPAMAATRPVLVELFTSQGCSSCPPADDVLSHLAQRADVVALAYHVDYWDYIGWKDPFARPAFTARQREYRKVFGNQSIYTPQMVFNGAVEFPGQNEPEATRAVSAAAQRADQGPSIALRRGADAITWIEIEASSLRAPVSVFGAVYGMGKSTRVSRGENAGRTLSNINMAKSVQILGPYAGDVTRISWQPDLTEAAGLAVWIQPNNLGPVSAVAQLRISSST